MTVLLGNRSLSEEIEGYEWKVRQFFTTEKFSSLENLYHDIKVFCNRMSGFINPEIQDEDLEFKEVKISNADILEFRRKVNKFLNDGWRFYTIENNLINDLTYLRLARLRRSENERSK